MNETQTARKEIRIAGFGGQGIVLSAVIMGKAAAIYMGKKSAVMQNYGPESRGGACSGAVVIDDEPVDYPYTVNPDILIILSQEAYTKYRGCVQKDSIMLVDEDLVDLFDDDPVIVYKVPAVRMAETLGKKIVANIIMLGALTGVSTIITFEAMKDAVLSMVPPKTRDLNCKAVEEGYQFGKKLIESMENPK